eukprot:scaffold1830_cov117-Cylindrotheca_fusiformis.AAC.19
MLPLMVTLVGFVEGPTESSLGRQRVDLVLQSRTLVVTGNCNRLAYDFALVNDIGGLKIIAMSRMTKTIEV